MFVYSVITSIIISIILEIYLYFNFKKFIQNNYILFGNMLLWLLVLGNFGYNLIFFDRNVGQTQTTMWATGLFMLFGFPRIILVLFFLFKIFLEDLVGYLIVQQIIQQMKILIYLLAENL